MLQVDIFLGFHLLGIEVDVFARKSMRKSLRNITPKIGNKEIKQIGIWRLGISDYLGCYIRTINGFYPNLSKKTKTIKQHLLSI